MAGSLTDFLELEVLDHILGVGAYTMPTIHIGLLTVAPTDSTAGTEVTGGSYARVAGAAKFSAAAAGSSANTAAVTFPTATANWGTCNAFGIYDAASVGNLLVWGDLTVPKAVNNGDTAEFAVGALVVNMD